MKHVTIVGAGISGLACAHYLAQQGIGSTVLEATDQVGGKAGWVEQGGERFEIGGKNFGSNWTRFMALLNEFGFSGFDRQHGSFNIVIDGKLWQFDKKKVLQSGWKMMRALGPRGAYQFRQFLGAVSANYGKLNHSNGLIEEIERRYDHAPLSAHFSRRAAWGPVRMFSIIMGGAEPDEMHYSNLCLALNGFDKGSGHSLPDTTAALFAKLTAGKDIRRNTRVTEIVVDRSMVRGVKLVDSAGASFEPTDGLICATPLHALRHMLDVGETLDRELGKIRYSPVALINAVYERDVFTDDISSIMFDSSSPLGHCSANRQYKKNSVRYTIAGRRGRALIDATDAELLALAEQNFRRYLPLPGKAMTYHVARHRDGICGYAPNFTSIKRRMFEFLHGVPNLELAGDYLEGHNMEGCLTSAEYAVQRLLEKAVTMPVVAAQLPRLVVASV
ncbi:MAG: FAD-dependent oxidoreductase [Gammaproteobacteria bacterium]|nr:FAD-dependent oxidoreductase [Gammaproteobacteria bacterium]